VSGSEQVRVTERAAPRERARTACAPRVSHEEGASAVEFAIIAPIVCGILLAILTGGLMFNSQLSLTHAAREGARFGATYPPVADWHSQVTDRAVAAATGELGEGAVGARTCVARYHAGVFTKSENGATPVPGSCFDDDLGGDRVQVTLERQTDFLAVLVNFRGMTLTSNATAQYEHGSSG
jgi:Flp pilus assembly protein TadG